MSIKCILSLKRGVSFQINTLWTVNISEQKSLSNYLFWEYIFRIEMEPTTDKFWWKWKAISKNNMETWDTTVGSPSHVGAELNIPKVRFSKQMERYQDTLCLLHTLALKLPRMLRPLSGGRTSLYSVISTTWQFLTAPKIMVYMKIMVN